MEVFVADELNGRWVDARWLPRIAALNRGIHAEVTGLSCSSVGNCAVVGWYLDSGNHHQAFAADERQGTWGSATAIPAVMALNAGADAQLGTVSCASAGNCEAGGYYADAAGRRQALLASERNGAWASATAVPGAHRLNVGGNAGVTAISCPAAGNCEATGFYSGPGHAGGMPFVVSEHDGTWGVALTVPGIAALNRGHEGGISSLACASPGDCVTGGSYLTAPAGKGKLEAFVAAQRGDVWSPAVRVPGSGALNAGGDADAFSVACDSAGNCVAGGYYTDGAGQSSAFIATERGGVWEAAAPLPGMPALSGGNASGIVSVSCAAAGYCVAGGFYQDAHGGQQAFVTSANGAGRHS